MSQTELQQIELNIEQAKQIRDLGKALERLQGNRDFKDVIVSGYLSKEAVRLVHLKADPSQQSYEAQQAILKQIDGIGSLESFFRVVEFKARQAEKAIEADELTREEMLAEEAQA